MTVEHLGVFKDAKLWPGGGRAWDWNETGTHHVPGIQPADIEEIVNHGANEIILTRGMLLALQTAEESRAYLESRDIRFHILETTIGANLYNQCVSEGKAVGGLFHSTC